MTLFLHELTAEQRLYWRSREAAFFTFIFPLLLYVLVSAFYTGKIDGEPAGRVLLAGLLGYAAATTTFAGISIFLVVRRENGVLKRLRATPLPPRMYIAALLASTLLVFALEAAAMILLARVVYHVGVPDRIGSLVFSLLLIVIMIVRPGGILGHRELWSFFVRRRRVEPAPPAVTG